MEEEEKRGGLLHPGRWPFYAAIFFGPVVGFTIGHQGEHFNDHDTLKWKFLQFVESIGLGFSGFLLSLILIALPYYIMRRKGMNLNVLYYVWTALTVAITVVGSGVLNK